MKKYFEGLLSRPDMYSNIYIRLLITESKSLFPISGEHIETQS